MNWPEFTKLLKKMTYKDKLYKLIKAEMKRRGNWRAAPRGKAFIKGNLEQSKGKK